MDAVDPARASVPMSPLPPTPDEHPHRRRSDTLSGWHPADDDESDRATRYRARKGLEVARRAEAAVDRVATSVEGLNARWDAAAKRWDDFKASVRGSALWALKVLGGALLLASLAAAIALVARVRLDPALPQVAAPR